jgi:hypothetical protein
MQHVPSCKVAAGGELAESAVEDQLACGIELLLLALLQLEAMHMSNTRILCRLVGAGSLLSVKQGNNQKTFSLLHSIILNMSPISRCKLWHIYCMVWS